MRPVHVAIPVVFALVAVACGSDDPSATTTSMSDPSRTTDATPPTSDDEARRIEVPDPVAIARRQPPSASAQIAGVATTAFGFDAFAGAADAASPDDNVVLSPLSIAIALGMLEPGATGEAQAQLRDLLRIDEGAEWHASMNALEQELESRRPDPPRTDEEDPGELHTNIANAAFIQPGYPFHQEYLDIVGANYGAVIEELDFAADRGAAADRINEFIADATDDRITDLVAEPDIDADTVLALVNALLLQASWQSQFDDDVTVHDDFTRFDGSTVAVPLMHGRSDRSGVGDGWVAATKVLVGNLGLQVVLPDEGRFDEVAASLDQVFADYERTATGGAELVVPRFDTRVRVGLTAVLQDIGLTAPFERGNLLAIADDDRLVLDKALHETWLSIDEEGIEAAAATVVLMIATSAPVEQPVPVVLDRPFLFRIVDGPSGATLFIGRIVDPTA